jgi:hypothetical protein
LNLITVRVLWASLLFSTLIELAVVLWADFDRHVDLDPLTFVLASVALAVAVASFVLPRRLHTTTLKQLALPVIEVPLQNTDVRDYRSAAGSQRVFRDAAAAQSAMVRAFQTPFIISLALTETVAVFGFVIAQGRFAPSSFALPFFAAAWVLFGLRFPTVARIVGPAEHLYGARLP